MSEIAELRKLFQDLIAPDLKAISAEQRSAESLAKARYDTVLAKLEVLETKLSAFDARTTARFDEINRSLDIDRRLERIEALQASRHAAA